MLLTNPFIYSNKLEYLQKTVGVVKILNRLQLTYFLYQNNNEFWIVKNIFTNLREK